MLYKESPGSDQMGTPVHGVAVLVVVLPSLSCVRLSVTDGLQHIRLPLSFTISWSLMKLMSIESVMPSNHLILCCPLLLLP